MQNRSRMTTFREAAAQWSAPRPEQHTDRVWVVDDEPAAADLACELCELAGLQAIAFGTAVSYLSALRGTSSPVMVILDWRLENELSAAVFMATRQRYATLPILFWTGSERGSLPLMVHHDPHVRVLAKAGGSAEFSTALAWALADGAGSGAPVD